MSATGRCLSSLLRVAILTLSLWLVPALALADPKEKAGEESPDDKFANSFLGKVYESEIEIDGWTDLGGGLVIPPVYVRHYQREDGTYLVLTSREVAKATRTEPASFVVADALIVPKPKGGAEFSIACVQGKDETLRFMGEAKGSPTKEWWTDVRRAWEITLDTGEIASIKPKGIRCTNVSWGQ
jgi:hypothetical protein